MPAQPAETDDMPLQDCFCEPEAHARLLYLVPVGDFADWRAVQPPPVRRWLEDSGTKPEAGSLSLLPAPEGGLGAAVLLVEDVGTWTLGDLPGRLPAGNWRLEAAGGLADQDRLRAAIGWGLGGYRFDRYLSAPGDEEAVRLAIDPGLREIVETVVEGVALVRDLVNTPAQDMMPEHLSEVAAGLARRYGAGLCEVCGEALLEENWPMVHAVGRASAHPPRLLDLSWGDPTHPRLTLVGKGVCFDSGGLDLKPANAMRLMKKDMGGAAHALGLAAMIMRSGLAVRLRVLIPAVENAVSGSAFRPGDILPTRKGLTVEIENTDAEGRLVLCDALHEACAETPDLLIDFATLTGAARVALGTEVPALFTHDTEMARELMRLGEDWDDPVWHLPLHRGYADQLKSRFADLLNCGTDGFAGAITAALFLERFVDEAVAWLHYDLMAWNRRNRPGRPEGGEAMGLLGLFDWLLRRYRGDGGR